MYNWPYVLVSDSDKFKWRHVLIQRSDPGTILDIYWRTYFPLLTTGIFKDPFRLPSLDYVFWFSMWDVFLHKHQLLFMHSSLSLSKVFILAANGKWLHWIVKVFESYGLCKRSYTHSVVVTNVADNTFKSNRIWNLIETKIP